MLSLSGMKLLMMRRVFPSIIVIIKMGLRMHNNNEGLERCGKTFYVLNEVIHSFQSFYINFNQCYCVKYILIYSHLKNNNNFISFF